LHDYLRPIALGLVLALGVNVGYRNKHAEISAYGQRYPERSAIRFKGAQKGGQKQIHPLII
jgi:hypothetical protein